MTVQELEEWFDGRELPAGPISPHKSMVIQDPVYFVASHLYSAKAVKNDKAREPILLRLIQLKEWIEANQGP